MTRALTLLLALFTAHAHAATPSPFAQPEILDPSRAYRLQIAVDGDGLEAAWRIEEGYYLYRDKLGFTSNTPGITIDTAALPPPSEVKEDPYFGRMAIYRGPITIPLTLQREAGTPDRVEIAAKVQGCADVGVCFPPETRRVAVELPARANATQAPRQERTALIASLSEQLGIGAAAEPEFLEPEQAFILSADPNPDGSGFIARWEIADGYYLYRDKFGFLPTADTPLELGSPDLPKGKVKDDPYFGRMEIYTGSVEAAVPARRMQAGEGPLEVTASFQGCADEGICYPPMRRNFVINLPFISSAEAAPIAAQRAVAATPAVAESLSEQDSIARSLAGGNFLLTVATFFGFGLLLAFTPCVFPMIPILSGIIVGQGAQVTTRRAFALSVSYVLAMAVTYTAAGVIAGLFGSNLQATFQNPWILGTFSGVFVLLALSMFGFYDLQMPSWLQTKLSEVSHRQQGGTLVGAGVMGILSALIVGPCVAAPLAGALIYIGQTGDAVLGGTALFALSLGMGAPLLAIGTSAGKLMPRAGAWMETIKQVFGVMLLGVAIWLLERIVPGPVTLLLWASLAVVTAIYLGALTPLEADSGGWRKLWKGLGLVLLAYGLTLVVGASRGSEDPLRPLGGFGVAGAAGTVHAELAFRPVKSLADVEREVATAAAAGRTVMLDFYADWCVTCKEMERETFIDSGVQQALASTTLLQADVTANDAVDQELLRHYGLIGPPSILFFARDGAERRGFRVMGFMPPEDFGRQIENALR